MTDATFEPGDLTPRFLSELRSPDCRTVLLVGCGGGFDFVHAMLLYPELVRLGKQVVIGSYSFGRPQSIGDPAPVVWSRDGVIVKQVTAASQPDEVYSPEVHLASYLDDRYRDHAPHRLYAYDARDFSVPLLTEFYQHLVDLHDVDTVVLVEGGTGSLVAGGEAGIGDPVEDATSVAAVGGLHGVARRILLTVGLGMDRCNGVSDATSLRAIAELTASGGFLGSLGIDPSSAGFIFYRDAVAHIHQRQRFGSTATGLLIAAAEGCFGGGSVPPLMSTIYAFHVASVARRSLIAPWIAAAPDHVAAYPAISAGRRALAGRCGIDLSRGFFRDVVEPLLGRLAPDLRYSAALIGPGSEVLGYDDEISTDHHWGPRVLVFCSEADASSEASRLSRELANRLPHRYAGYPTNFTEPDPSDHGTQLLRETGEGPVNHRVEIVSLHRWVADYLGLEPAVLARLDPLDWLTLPQQKLLTITTGAVFRDDEGRLGGLRAALGWYPEDVWRYLLASVWQRIGQEEHLVGRAGQSGDETGARVIAARLVRDAMRLCLLAERRYAPYAKWLGRAFGELDAADELGPLLDAVLEASDWQRRDAALRPVWEALARRHNALGITPPLPEEATPFFGRPFHVVAIHGFAAALLATITSDWLTPVLRRAPVGGIDLLSDSTDLLEESAFRVGVRDLLASGLPEIER